MPKRNKAFRDEAGNNYVPIENKMYMGLHFANDASMGNNAEVDGNLLTFATEEIDIGDEVLFEHKWKTGWSNKKKKSRQNAASKTTNAQSRSTTSNQGGQPAASQTTSNGSATAPTVNGKRKRVDIDFSHLRKKYGYSS